MFTELSLTNFKSWKQLDAMRLGRITGLFGTNSSGKSSLIQALLLLKQTAESNDQNVPLQLGDDDSYVNLGSYAEVVHGHDESAAVGIGLKVRLGDGLSFRDDLNAPSLWGDSIQVSLEVAQSHHLVSLTSLRYQFADHAYGVVVTEQEGMGEAYQFMTSDERVGEKVSRTAFFNSNPGKGYAIPMNILRTSHSLLFLKDLENLFEIEVKATSYLGPLREPPSREYRFRNSAPSDVGVRGEYAIAALVASRNQPRLVEEYNPFKNPLEAIIAKQLVRLGLLHSFELVKIEGVTNLYQVRVQREEGSPQVLITDVGFGVSQILPVLVLCYYAPRGSTIIIEQPELHMHPRVQTELADIFIEVAQQRDVQIILESHSEHLLQRLQRRIAEEKLAREDVALYFCSQSRGESVAEELKLDPYGNIRNWPPDFFGNEFAEMAAMTEAAAKRKAARGN